MSKYFRKVNQLIRRRQRGSDARSSTSSQRESFEEMEIATQDLIASMYENPSSSLAPDSSATVTFNLGSQSACTSYSQPKRSTVTFKSIPESVPSGSNFPGQTSLTSTEAAGQPKLDPGTTIFSSVTHSAVDLVVHVLSATYSKCFIYPKGQFKFPDFRATDGYERNECYRLYLYQDGVDYTQGAIENPQRLISRVEYAHVGTFGDISPVRDLPSTVTRQEYSYLSNELPRPLIYWNPDPIPTGKEQLRIAILKLARNDDQNRIEVDFQLFLKPGCVQDDSKGSIDLSEASRLTIASGPSACVADDAAADPDPSIVREQPPSPTYDDYYRLAVMFWALIDLLESEHKERDQSGNPLFLAGGSRGLVRKFHLAIKIEDGQLEAWESLAHRLNFLKLPRLQYPEIKNKGFLRNISSEETKINIVTVPVDRSNLRCEWENFTLDRCSITRRKEGWIQFDFAIITLY